MGIKVNPEVKDEKLGVIEKKVKLGKNKIVTPIKGTKVATTKSIKKGFVINEISKQIKPKTLERLNKDIVYAADFRNKTKKDFLNGVPNILYFDLKLDHFPSETLISTLSHNLYSLSEEVICLPFVKSGLLRGRSQIMDKKVKNYLKFQDEIIENIKLKNSKSILGVVPIVAPKYTKDIVSFYYKNGINSFVIDSGTSNIWNKEPELRSILTSIDRNAREDNKTLEDVYIQCVNLGIDQFKAVEIPADDFLSLFAYIDVFGIQFKTRGGSSDDNRPRPKPRKKLFSRNKYTYKIVKDSALHPLGIKEWPLSYQKRRIFNEKAQFLESQKIHNLIGEGEKLYKYVQSKKAVDNNRIRRLERISKIIK